MKKIFAGLLVLLGAVLGAFTFSANPIPDPIISIGGGFALGFSFLVFTAVYSGRVWGIAIKSSSFSKVKTLISAAGLVFGGYSMLFTALSAFVSLFSGRFVNLLLCVIGFLGTVVVGAFVGKIFLEKTLSKENGARILGEFELFKAIDENMEQAEHFVVGFEGVALFSSTNYCYAVYKYNDFQLGELSSPSEVALVGSYFVQKYHEKYTFKVDMEVIPGEPGQTIVAVGSGGVGVARIQGTPDQHIFRSYIFSKKK